MKKCNKCGLEKTFDQFFKDKINADGYCGKCKACKTASTMEWRAKNKDYYNASQRKWQAEHKDNRRDCDYKRKYGITLEEYEQKLKEQGGVCWICQKPNTSLKRQFAVDHNHETGKVRGILCFNCNRCLTAWDNKKVLERTLLYLETFKG